MAAGCCTALARWSWRSLLWKLVGVLFAPKKKPPPAPPVKVARALKKDVIVTQNTIGTVVSPAMVQVTAQVGGKLLVANFHEGDIVHKGDVLFQIDPAPYEAALAQAQGQLARDQATLANDKVDLLRYQSLAAQNAISNQQLVTQEAKLKSDAGVVQIRPGQCPGGAHQCRLYPHHIAHRRQDRRHLHPARQCDHRLQLDRPAAGHHHPDPAHQGVVLPAAERAGPDPEPVQPGQADACRCPWRARRTARKRRRWIS